MFSRLLVLVGVVGILSGCGGNKPLPSHSMPSMIEAEFLPHKTIGTGSVVGQVFLNTKGGDVKFGAGSKVCLIPDNNYLSDRSLKKQYGFSIKDDSGWLATFKCTQADAEGRFSIEGLSSAAWLAESNVFWSRVSCSKYLGCSTVQEGDYIKKKISSVDGEVVKVVLTK